MDFEILLNECRRVVERFVFYRISNIEDAEDILQETYLTAFQKFNTLKDKTQFKAWIIRIAKNKCNDYYRKSFKEPEFIEQNLEQLSVFSSNSGFDEQSLVWDTIKILSDKEREIISLYYFIGYSQEEISKRLKIPLGTVKSRLYNAKANFKENYPYIPQKTMKGDIKMNLPKTMPDYRIIKSSKEPFSTKWEELMGWLIVPKPGEKIKWALYDFPERNQTEYVEMEVAGKAFVHGVEGVEITAKEYNPVVTNIIDSDAYAERRFVAQLTDTHCRFLAESHKQNGATKYYTFLDDDEFIKNWGFGEDNCGKETDLCAKGFIKRNDDNVICDKIKCLDIVGRYTVIIGSKEFDTVCVMDIESYESGVVTEQYVDRNGRTVLWRRFNADDWKLSYYKDYWSNKLPQNEKLFVNGKAYVHWYDCISDYVF